MQQTPRVSGVLAWPLILSITLVLFVVSSILVLVGTSWPILTGWFGKTGTVNSSFYNEVSLPIYILLGLLLGLGPFLTWVELPAARWVRRFALPIVVASLATLAAYLLGGRGVGQLLLFFAGMMALTANIIRFANLAPHRLLTTGASIAHIGFALMLIGIVASESWDSTSRARLPKDEATEVLGHTLIYRGHVAGTDGKDRWAIEVGSAAQTKRFEMTFYQLENGQSFRKPAILRRAMGDIYVSPEEIGRNRGGAGLELVKGEPQDFAGATLTFQRFDMGEGTHEEMSLSAVVDVVKDGQTESLTLPVRFYGGKMEGAVVESQLSPGLALSLQGMSVEQGLIRVSAADPSAAQAESMLLEVSDKPLIGLLWLGTVLVFVGCGVAMARRWVDRLLDESTALHQAKGMGGQRTARPEPVG
ncbi:MAG: cytochrome c-type biogenesis CcmF C-terminal domain-containing protein [Candidatus Eisenbacteria bacterium]